MCRQNKKSRLPIAGKKLNDAQQCTLRLATRCTRAWLSAMIDFLAQEMKKHPPFSSLENEFSRSTNTLYNHILSPTDLIPKNTASKLDQYPDFHHNISNRPVKRTRRAKTPDRKNGPASANQTSLILIKGPTPRIVRVIQNKNEQSSRPTQTRLAEKPVETYAC